MWFVDFPFAIRDDQGTDGAVRLALIGELDLAHSDDLAERIRAAAIAGASVRLDLCELRFIDVSGLRVLVEAAQAARRGGWRLDIAWDCMRQVRRVIDLTGAGVLLWPGDGYRARPATATAFRP